MVGCLAGTIMHADTGTDDLRGTMFDVETASALRRNLHDNDVDVVGEALKMLGLAINYNDLREKIFDVATTSAVRSCAEQSLQNDVQAEAGRLLGLIEDLTQWPFAVPHVVRPVPPM